jgi:hypothetical protein
MITVAKDVKAAGGKTRGVNQRLFPLWRKDSSA